MQKNRKNIIIWSLLACLLVQNLIYPFLVRAELCAQEDFGQIHMLSPWLYCPEPLFKETFSSVCGEQIMLLFQARFKDKEIISAADLDTGSGNFVVEFGDLLRNIFPASEMLGVETFFGFVDPQVNKTAIDKGYKIIEAAPEDINYSAQPELKDSSKDIITINNISKADSHIAQALRMLKPDGLLIITVAKTDISDYQLDEHIETVLKEKGMHILRRSSLPRDYPPSILNKTMNITEGAFFLAWRKEYPLIYQEETGYQQSINLSALSNILQIEVNEKLGPDNDQRIQPMAGLDLDGDFSAHLDIPEELIQIFSQVRVKDSTQTIMERLREIVTTDSQDAREDGRSDVISFAHAITWQGADIKSLRCKGIYPQVNGEQVKEYTKGDGYVSTIPSINENGQIYCLEEKKNPFGTILYKRAQYEFKMHEELTSKAIAVDVPLGIGYYNDISFQGQQVGFALYGLESEQDLRCNTADYMNCLTQMGELLRKIHDAGYVHRYPHFGNFGMVKTTDGIKVVAKDLGSMFRINDMAGENFQEQVIAFRWLDISKMLWGYLQYQMEFTDEISPTKRTLQAVPQFVSGYFGDNWPDYIDTKNIFTMNEDKLGTLFDKEIVNLYNRYINPGYDPAHISDSGEIYKALYKISQQKNKRTQIDQVNGDPQIVSPPAIEEFQRQNAEYLIQSAI